VILWLENETRFGDEDFVDGGTGTVFGRGALRSNCRKEGSKTDSMVATVVEGEGEETAGNYTARMGGQSRSR